MNELNKVVKERLESYDSNVAAAREIFERKNTEYGDSIRFGGMLAASYEIVGAAMRLPTLVFFAADHGRSNTEKLYDIFLDIMNYANIALQMMREENFEGKF
ncbi:MAG TPA: hypothetical protein PK410_00025 [Paludibacteraceae bacterium]|jgi:hypothetical protein|nr:hypothetical protein [Paludibacteraceae bacterium]